MGASTTIAHALLTIAAIAVAATFAFTMIAKTTTLNSGISQMLFSQSQNLRMDITIIDFYYDTTNNYFTIYAKNTGYIDINLSLLNDTDIYLGEYGSELDLYTYNQTGGAGHWNYTQTDNDSSVWSTGETLVIHLFNQTSIDTPYYLKMVLPNGESDEMVKTG